MEKVDLALVTIDDLLKELESRCETFVCAYAPVDFQTKEEMKFYYGNGSWHTACSLANILNKDVLNNWRGELKTLQSLNEEEEGEL